MAASHRTAVVIGAGVVGLAVAREFALRGWWVVVLEKAGAPGTGITSRSSEVIHAGLYYRPGSLKARLCVEGRERMYGYLDRRSVPHHRCGKVIVAVTKRDVARLEALRDRGVENGVEPDALRLLGEAELRDLEPCVRGRAALSVAVTGIVDTHSLVRALVSDVAENGGSVALRVEFVMGEPSRGRWRLTTTNAAGEKEEIDCDVVINAAGLYADEVARSMGPRLDGLPRQEWVKGSYFALRPGSSVHASRLVYPLPRRDGRGLGVHLTVDLSGACRLGPDVEPLSRRREVYQVSESRREEFARAGRRFLPQLRAEDLAPAYAGIRPQLARRGGFRDFYIAHEERRGARGWVNLMGIESPGLTCALAIGREVADMVEA